MSALVHPDQFEDYCEMIHRGEAVPSVYHSLVEAAIRDGVAPDRILIAWSLRESLWSAVSAAGIVFLVMQMWWLGIVLIFLSLWGGLKHGKPLNVRLAYCAVVDGIIGAWAMRHGYLSLVPIPTDQQGRFVKFNSDRLRVAETDVYQRTPTALALTNVVVVFALLIGKLVLGVLLLLAAWREPSWITILIGGSVGLFCIVQSLVRLPMMCGFGSRRVGLTTGCS